jgi:hypothetical protein
MPGAPEVYLLLLTANLMTKLSMFFFFFAFFFFFLHAQVQGHVQQMISETDECDEALQSQPLIYTRTRSCVDIG